MFHGIWCILGFRHRLQPIGVAAAKVALAPFPTLSSNPRYLENYVATHPYLKDS